MSLKPAESDKFSKAGSNELRAQQTGKNFNFVPLQALAFCVLLAFILTGSSFAEDVHEPNKLIAEQLEQSKHPEPGETILPNAEGVVQTHEHHFVMLRHGGKIIAISTENGPSVPDPHLGQKYGIKYTWHEVAEGTNLFFISSGDARGQVPNPAVKTGSGETMEDQTGNGYIKTGTLVIPWSMGGWLYLEEAAKEIELYPVQFDHLENCSGRLDAKRWIKLVKKHQPGEIFIAAQKGDLALVTELIKTHPDLVFTNDGRGQTPLRIAVQWNHVEIAQLLLANKATYSIHDVAALGDLEKVKTLLNEHPDLVMSQDSGGRTPLHWAASSGKKDVVDLLLSLKADVNATNSFGWTPLRFAAENDHKDVMELLLVHKAEVDTKDRIGRTALLMAAYAGHQDVVELLLAKGADVGVKGDDGLTALHWAAAGGHQQVVELLLDNHADINAGDKRGGTPLDWAAGRGHQDVAEFLRQHGGRE